MPSPTIATTIPSFRSDATASSFCCGRTSATNLSMPSPWAMAAAVRELSPVSITTWMPIPFRASTAAFADGLTVSASATTPAALPSEATTMTVFPSPSSLANAAPTPERSTPLSAAKRPVPTRTAFPST